MDLDDIADDEPLIDEEDQLDEDLGEFEDTDDPPETDDQDDEPSGQQTTRQPGRKDRRIAAIETRANTEKARADALEAELNAIRRGPTKTPQELASERAAKMSNMTEAQRLEFLIQENDTKAQQRMDQIQFAGFEVGDKAAFDALCDRNPAVAKLKDEIESTLMTMRKNGQNADRATVAAYVIGQKALKAQPKAKARGRQIAEDGQQRQGARPANGRGDVAATGGRKTNERDARRARLEGQKL